MNEGGATNDVIERIRPALRGPAEPKVRGSGAGGDDAARVEWEQLPEIGPPCVIHVKRITHLQALVGDAQVPDVPHPRI
eukprot:CAMPEP_0177793504 /NCGR_PEP_ID=MMETSP0491_2-20121128/25110_1 /TAXON_ID=63592 /ORGANISM="Tetraselmis chuii, Strain PLY429" /LENGTH=78 /DNA_ID=CAMNT_0019316023 /DNA_START=92 /DNA_END=329 /DNA_ORIENTATION=+